MPILPPEYISTWYYFRDGANLVRVFESWSETQEQDVQPQSLLQGDIGTHVMNVGGIKWVTRIDSPALIVEFNDGSEGVTDSFDLLVYAFNYLRNPVATRSISTAAGIDVPDYLMRSGKVTIGEEGVSVSMEIVSSREGALKPNTLLSSGGETPNDWSSGYASPPPDFIARVARFYDVQFSLSDSSQTFSYAVIKADITFKVNLSENYFINTSSQAPYFGVQGYHVSGEVEIAVPPEYYRDLYIPGQNTYDANGVFQALNANNTNVSLYLTGHENGLLLGQTQLRSSVSRNLRPNQISTVTVNFETFTRYSTWVSGQ